MRICFSSEGVVAFMSVPSATLAPTPRHPRPGGTDRWSEHAVARAFAVVQEGFTNLSVIRSLSPMASYFAWSTSFRANTGGSVHTPDG